jgi:F-type H+-transporting ATPase subunit b
MQDGIIEFSKYMLENLGFQMFNTVIVIGFLSYFLYNPVKKMMQERTNGINKQITDSESNLKESNNLKLSYESKLKDIEKERTEILDNARKIAIETEKNIVLEAKKEAEIIKTRAMSDIKLEEEKSKDAIKNQMIEISMLMAQKYISTNIDEATQNKLLEEVISDLGDSKWLS